MRELILLICLVGLWGCSSTPPDVTLPDGQVLRSYQPYQVNGVWYYPQHHYEYEEEGIASWYGPGFHGRKKAYGGWEVYDQEGISAAHKTLPLPTIVKVTNLKNGKSLKLLVDDRGPYVDDRIIDLSKGAARNLGLLNAGLARVKVEALSDESMAFSKYLRRYGRTGVASDGRTWHTIYREEIEPHFSEAGGEAGAIFEEVPPVKIEKKELYLDPSPLDHVIEVVQKAPQRQVRPSKPQAMQQKDAYYVEVGHFLHKKNADAILAELRPIARGQVNPFVAAKQQRLYAVKLGPFPSKNHAKAALQNLSAIGYSQASVILS